MPGAFSGAENVDIEGIQGVKTPTVDEVAKIQVRLVADGGR
jgi:hypothetical protein